jgi:DNA-binding transcriptional LysR family regulator
MRKQKGDTRSRLLEEMAAFAKVADAKSFSGAARATGLSKAAISKQIARLETNLGAKLINRTTRRLSLTEAGQVLYTHCSRINEEAEAAHQAVSQLFSEPRGVLRVSASVAFGIQHVMPAIPDFLRAFPRLSVHVGLADRFVDIVQEGFDIVIRLTDTPGPNVVARKLATFGYVLCASPAYLAEHGTPKAPQELADHNCLFYSNMNPDDEWELEGPEGRVSVRVSGKILVNSSEAVRIAAQQGLGIALEPTYAVGDDLHRGTLRTVLPGYRPRGRFGNSVFAVYLPTRHVPPKTRAFIDFFIQRFGSMPYWAQPRR